MLKARAIKPLNFIFSLLVTSPLVATPLNLIIETSELVVKGVLALLYLASRISNIKIVDFIKVLALLYKNTITILNYSTSKSYSAVTTKLIF
ncbi:uncharacterized protein RAG0_11714 [Rhynchosporium agropyri]|uniref:Uncharacterized protein n=1 Tax=Rhynchosporium agropyri TaxID=914238 RepID=A0A1E1L5B3_9HELO|nr:uncharacterized protein RAG0_11714 [Rhynchosporium agropyri]